MSKPVNAVQAVSAESVSYAELVSATEGAGVRSLPSPTGARPAGWVELAGT